MLGFGVDVGCFDCKCFCPLHWRIYCSYLAYLPYLIYRLRGRFWTRANWWGGLPFKLGRSRFGLTGSSFAFVSTILCFSLSLTCIYLQHVKLIDALLLGFDMLERHTCGLEKIDLARGLQKFFIWSLAKVILISTSIHLFIQVCSKGMIFFFFESSIISRS